MAAQFHRTGGFCDRLFAHNPRPRMCLIGSESGFAGSFDMAYAGAKAALHLYVETKRLSSARISSWSAIAPTIIWDTDMTQTRPDLASAGARGGPHGTAGGSRPARWRRRPIRRCSSPRRFCLIR
jgi:NAD(P)-dependent dehydrogenase (short-subunit alcohol dehydrogenase family)